MFPLRVAIIGTGQIVQRGHLPGYSRAGAQVVALASVAEQELAEVAAAHGVARRYADWKQMLRDGGFDAVSVCTPPGLHAEMAVASAQAGCHVLVEKPMALSLEECEQMTHAATESGVLLMISHNQRFVAHHRLAKDIVQSGRLGRPLMAHAVFAHGGPEYWSPQQQWYFNPALAGNGVLMDLGSHKVDLLRWLLEDEVIEVAGMGATFEKRTPSTDCVGCVLRFSRGTLATLQVSWVYRPGWDNSLVIQCERGILRVPTEATDPVTLAEQTSAGQRTETFPALATDDPSGWFGAVGAFVGAIRDGSPSPVSGLEGARTMAAVLAIGESMQRQTVVHLTGADN